MQTFRNASRRLKKASEPMTTCMAHQRSMAGAQMSAWKSSFSSIATVTGSQS